MSVTLYSHQAEAVAKLQNGSILCGGVGSGKSRTAIVYYVTKVCKGGVKLNGKGQLSTMLKPTDLYIITTAKKRDSLDWERECANFMLSTKMLSIDGCKVVVDSWNNIRKYIKVKNAFFIFDEQRIVGSGAWAKAFISISKYNQWILLTATPGDTWLDYIPIIIAHGYYRNRTEFLRAHVVFNPYVKYPSISKYVDEKLLYKIKAEVTVMMPYSKLTVTHDHLVRCSYPKKDYDKCLKTRWNIYEDRPIKTASELCYILRRIVNSDVSRLLEIVDIIAERHKVIIFYNFDYELAMLRELCNELPYEWAEWNGHKHEELPATKHWIYLVQYTAGAEGWNCITTDTIIFYSQNYSYKVLIQAAGRIDRLNTPYRDLHYYHLTTTSTIDLAINKAVKTKKLFNASNFGTRE